MAKLPAETKQRIKKDFLAALCDGYSVTGACHQAGIGRKAIYAWKKESPTFAAEWDEAWEARGDWYEDRNREAAIELQMPAILNGLRMHKRIVERHELSGAGGGPIKHSHSITPTTLAEAAQILTTLGQNGHANGQPEPTS